MAVSGDWAGKVLDQMETAAGFVSSSAAPGCFSFVISLRAEMGALSPGGLRYGFVVFEIWGGVQAGGEVAAGELDERVGEEGGAGDYN